MSDATSGSMPDAPRAATGERSGLISLFVRHPTAANLLMAIMVIVGVYSVQKLNTQFFPTLEIPVITVSVAWPGASAEDVEKNIIDAIEPEIRFLDDVEDVTSIAREGAATITLEFFSDADMQKAQSEVEQAVSRITTLPEDSEEPVISRINYYEGVANIAVHGPFAEAEIKSFAKTLRDGLLNAGIDRVSLSGSRREEIWVHLREDELRRLDVSIADIATRIRQNTDDQPSGILEGSVEMQLRAVSERKTPEEIGSIEIKALPSGERVLLRDIADVQPRFNRSDKIGLINGEPAIELNVQRAVAADTLKTMEAMQAYIATARPQFPPALKLEVYDVRGELVVQRLGILVKNGLQGLVLVLITLFIFLNARIAFWCAAGIPIAFMATLAVMYVSGQTINMISMFALIMMLGIIVDDAIVVGEHTATRQALGDSPVEAAERGAGRMLLPVVAATLTTLAAFFPITLIQGRIGDIMGAIPLVVFAVLIASVIECFLILPGHLRHSAANINKKPGWFRRNFDRMLENFRDGPFDRFVHLTYRWRYTTVAVTIASLFVAMGLVQGGRVGFTFFPSPEGEQISAYIVFGSGTPREDQLPALQKIQDALLKTEQQMLAAKRSSNGAANQPEAIAENTQQVEASEGEAGLAQRTLRAIRGLISSGNQAELDQKLVKLTFTTLGQAGRGQGDNLAEIQVHLTPSESRTILTKDIISAWRRNLPDIAGVERVTLLGQRTGPPGRDLDIRLQNAPVEALKAAAEEVKVALTGFPGISGVSDDLPYGKPEIVLELTPRGAALGFTGESVGAQVRNSFEGAIAARFARGDEEITVRVKLDQQGSGVRALRELYLVGPGGQRVPLAEVVTVREKTGFSIIQRRDGARTVGVTADVDSEVIGVQEIVQQLRTETMPPIAEKYGVTFEFKGRDQERADSFRDLGTGTLLALSVIYIVLAWVFASYWAPLAVMSIIPFGVVGAIVGHMVMGMPLTIISMIGLLGLSGILVNDSIILVTTARERLALGQPLAEAAPGAARDRLRAVLLTSLTTIGGLLPLLFETSRQAQFLIPMAITLVFGLAAATVLVLVLVPSLLGVGGDISSLAQRFWRMISPAPASNATGGRHPVAAE